MHHQYITGVIIYLICLRQLHYFSLIPFRVKSQFSDLTSGALNILVPIHVSSFVSPPLHKIYVPLITNYIHTSPWIHQDPTASSSFLWLEHPSWLFHLHTSSTHPISTIIAPFQSIFRCPICAPTDCQSHLPMSTIVLITVFRHCLFIYSYPHNNESSPRTGNQSGLPSHLLHWT